MTPSQRQQQLINRIYGNLAIENPRITRTIVASIMGLREMFKVMPLERRYQRIGNVLVEIPWPEEVMYVWDHHMREQQIRDHIGLNVFLGILPGHRWP